jgi:hypothetical protein
MALKDISLNKVVAIIGIASFFNSLAFLIIETRAVGFSLDMGFLFVTTIVLFGLVAGLTIVNLYILRDLKKRDV